MTTRRIIYDATICVIAFFILIPIVLLFSGSVIGGLIALSYSVLLGYVLRGTNGGRWLFREWWKATLRIEKAVLGDISE